MRKEAVIAVSLILLAGLAIAQPQNNTTSENISTDAPATGESPKLAEGIISHKFNIKGNNYAPAADNAEDRAEEQIDKAEEKAEQKLEEIENSSEFRNRSDRDENNSVTISMEQAKKTALDKAGETWELEESDLHEEDGYFKFEFTAAEGEGEAEIRVDASTGEIFRFEGELESKVEDLEEKAEKKLEQAEEKVEKTVEAHEEGSVSLTGFVTFKTGGYEVETDAEKDNGVVKFTVEIESPDEDAMATQQLDKKTLSESVDAEPGKYTANLEVVMDGETVHTRSESVVVRKANQSGQEAPEESPENQDLHEKSKSELIEMVKDLREQVEKLRSEQDEGTVDPSEPVENEAENETEKSENETESEGETDQEASGDVSNDSGAEEENVPGGENSQRPGFVNQLLGSIFN